jgi:AcrR family transcriptional regulator
MTTPPASGKRERTKQANREAILDAARDVFADLGYGASTVRDIVRRTDLATGTFYNYFPDKESVLHALLEEAAGEARQRVREARRRGTTVEEFVHGGFLAYFSYLLEDRRTFEVLRRNEGTIRAMFEDPSVVAGAVELAEDLRAGIAAGIVPDHDAELMATAMVGAGMEVGMRLLDDTAPDAEAAAEFVTTVFVAGLRAVGSR